ncbi:MAG: HIT family protein [Bacteroidales bacterium]
MATIFSKIVKGEIPSYKVAESDKFYAFLDINPITKGHTLVIPKDECDYIFDMKSEDFSSLFAFAQVVAKAIKTAVPCKRVAVAVLGLEVPHAHIHLVPINNEGDLDFKRGKLKLESQEMASIANMISANIK